MSMYQVWSWCEDLGFWVFYDSYNTEAVARINADFIAHDGRKVKVQYVGEL